MLFPSLLLRWYQKHGRTLPWRGHPDAYAVWVSEIMLQQTRVEAVIPYFERWMARFPSLRDLAEASEQNVLNLWEGLGYYSRARNLHKAARVIVDEFDGHLPRSVEALRKLPGIGRYTAAAIASIAFDLDEPTMDGNIRRVYARLFNVDIPADSTEGEKLLWGLAAENLPKGKAGDYNQALMDLGAIICLPKNPRCESCPLKKQCMAFQLGLQESRPVLKPKSKIPHHVHAAVIIVGRIGNPPTPAVLLSKRPSRGLLGGLWEFPNARVASDPAKELTKAIRSEYSIQLRRGEALDAIHHVYSHFSVEVHAFLCQLSKPIREDSRQELKWVKLSDLDDYPMGKVDRQIAQKIKTPCDSAEKRNRTAKRAKAAKE
ncbi:MAG: A/G-specific adenine glycosylase [Chloroflexota bacterium]